MTIPKANLAGGYSISRIIKGGWHLAGDHGTIDQSQALQDMAAFVEAGITTFDCADIYTGVEELIGAFRKAYPELATSVKIHTKFVPDLQDLAQVDRHYVERIIDRSLSRLGVEQIDVVQFHWWDYDVPGCIDTACELDRLRQSGKIAHLGVTNFDTPRLIALLESGLTIVSHQLQYSLIDSRPQGSMAEVCQKNGIGLLCYGTVAGGFLSERWLGQNEPGGDLTNRSLIKYKLIIDDFGGWSAFQELLAALHAIARKHGVDIATVATRAILDRPNVAAAIVGATNTAHLAAHEQIEAFSLDEADMKLIRQLSSSRPGPTGDVYALERDRTGPHGQIMKYDLNRK